MDFGAISIAKFCGRENFRKLRSETRCESHESSRAAACRRSAQLLGTSAGHEQAEHCQAAWISARSRAISNAKFCGREHFSKISVANRTQSHAPQHADARHGCYGPLRVVRRLRVTRRHGFRRVPARFRPRNFAAAKNFSKISVRNPLRIARNLTRRSMPTLGTVYRNL